jgi:Holliday junction DNA helicase RuvA
MIAFIKGTVADIQPDVAVLEAGNMGYNVRISAGTAAKLPGIGSPVKLFTYTSVREDAIWLYGFLSSQELELFKKCISVNGVGPKVGLALLSTLDADALRLAIVTGDAAAIAKAPGIGKKTAERLILDLKDKLPQTDTLGELPVGSNTFIEQSADKQEAVAALTALGYGLSESQKAVQAVPESENSNSGAILKAALKIMMNG